MFLNWLRRTSNNNPRGSGRPARFRPQLESLEGRLAPATHQWTGAVSTAWSDDRNWVGGSPQGDSSAVLIFPSNPTRLTSTNNLGVINIQEIQIFGSGYTIQSFASSTQRIVLGAGGIDTFNSSGTNTITAGITLSGADRQVMVLGGAAATLNLAGVIDGPGGLLKGGAGQLIFSGAGANTYTGATTVVGGVLRLDKDPTDGAIKGDLIVGGSSGSPGTVILDQGNQIANTGTVTVNSRGLLNLNSTIDFIGDLVLNAGDAQSGSGGQLILLGDVTATSVVTDGATNAAAIRGDLGLLKSDATFTVNDGPATSDLVVSAKIIAGTDLIKEGAGQMVLQADNDHGGVTRVNAGTLRVDHVAGLGSSDAADNTVVAAGATLDFLVSGTVAEPIVLNGAGVADRGALRYSGTSTTDLLRLSGRITLASDATINVASATARGLQLFSLPGPSIDGPGGLIKTGAGRLLLDGDNNFDADNTFQGAVRVSAGTLEVSEPGSLGAGTSAIQVDAGATLQVIGLNYSRPLILDGQGVNGGGAFRADTFARAVWSGDVTLVGDAVVAGGAEFRGKITGPGGLTVGVPQGVFTTLTLAGAEANSYAGLTHVVQGRLILAKSPGVNAVPGALLVESGALFGVSINSSEQIPDTAPVTLRGGALGVADGAVETIGLLALEAGRAGSTGTGVLNLTTDVSVAAHPTNPSLTQSQLVGNVNLGSATRAFNFLDANAFLDVNGALSGAAGVGLVKNGGGLMRILAASTYTGPTVVNGGILDVFTGSLQSAVTVNAGATLAGVVGASGVPNVKGITSAGGTVSPGGVSIFNFGLSSPGNLLFDGDVSLDVASRFREQLNGTGAGQFDRLTVTGAVNLGGATLDASLGFNSQVGNSFVILANDGTDAIQGRFAGLEDSGDTFNLTGPDGQTRRFLINYGGGDGNDVELTHINAAPQFPGRSVTSLVREGDVVTLTGTISELDAGDTFTLVVDWGDGTPVETHTFPPGSDGQTVRLTHRYLDDNPSGTPQDEYTIRLDWHDQHGAGNRGELKVTVQNVAPEVEAGGPAVVRQGSTFSRSVLFTDPGADTWTATVDYGDGTGVRELAPDPSGKRFHLRHKYRRPGRYRVTVTVRDDDGGVRSESFIVLVLPGKRMGRRGRG